MADRARRFGVLQIAAALKDSVVYEALRALEGETARALADLNQRVLDLESPTPGVSPTTVFSAKNDRGVAVLAAGTVRVYTAKLYYDSTILVCHRGPPPLGTLGHVYADPVKRNIGGGYFDIDSSDATDDSEVEWVVLNDIG